MRSSACCRQENATFLLDIHGTWEAYFSMSLYSVPTDDYWFGNVSLWGDLYIQYAGFPFLGKSSFSLVYEIKTYDDRDILLQMTTPSLLLARLW